MRTSSIRKPQRLVVLAALLVALSAGAAAHAGVAAASPRSIAARNVLSVLSRSWNPVRIHQLVDPRTRLPRDNVHAVCWAAGHRRANGRRGRFTCAISPQGAHSRARLWVSYRRLRGGRFRVHWLSYRKG